LTQTAPQVVLVAQAERRALAAGETPAARVETPAAPPARPVAPAGLTRCSRRTDAPDDVAADAPGDVAADAPEDVAADAPEDVAADAPEDVAADAPEDVAADTPEDVAADVPGDVAADAPEDASFDAAVPCTEPGALTWSQNGHCYFRLQGQPKDWPTQRDACVAAGAHLVTITSQEENDFVRQLVSGQDRWIGLRRPQAGEPFSWVTGEPVSYTAWAAGEPNETGEACARLPTNTNPQTWADRPCNQTYSAICERP
jgi:hypothetical protein